MSLGLWPKGRLDTARLASVAPHLDTIELVLDDPAGKDPHLYEYADNPQMSADNRIGRSSRAPQPLELPWLDSEKALIIGAGDDYGDDTWLVLDYRNDAREPRVVYNEWRKNERGAFWVEAAPTFGEFWRLATGSPTGVWTAKPGPFSAAALAELEHVERKRWPQLIVGYLAQDRRVEAIAGSGRLIVAGRSEALTEGTLIAPPCVAKMASGSMLKLPDYWAYTFEREAWIEFRRGGFDKLYLADS